MRKCPNCGHQYYDQQESLNECPACGRTFTVNDLGALTVNDEFIDPQAEPKKKGTEVEAPGKPLIPVEPGAGTVVDVPAVPSQPKSGKGKGRRGPKALPKSSTAAKSSAPPAQPESPPSKPSEPASPPKFGTVVEGANAGTVVEFPSFISQPKSDAVVPSQPPSAVVGDAPTEAPKSEPPAGDKDAGKPSQPKFGTVVEGIGAGTVVDFPNFISQPNPGTVNQGPPQPQPKTSPVVESPAAAPKSKAPAVESSPAASPPATPTVAAGPDLDEQPKFGTVVEGVGNRTVVEFPDFKSQFDTGKVSQAAAPSQPKKEPVVESPAAAPKPKTPAVEGPPPPQPTPPIVAESSEVPEHPKFGTVVESAGAGTVVEFPSFISRPTGSKSDRPAGDSQPQSDSVVPLPPVSSQPQSAAVREAPTWPSSFETPSDVKAPDQPKPAPQPFSADVAEASTLPPPERARDVKDSDQAAQPKYGTVVEGQGGRTVVEFPSSFTSQPDTGTAVEGPVVPSQSSAADVAETPTLPPPEPARDETESDQSSEPKFGTVVEGQGGRTVVEFPSFATPTMKGPAAESSIDSLPPQAAKVAETPKLLPPEAPSDINSWDQQAQPKSGTVVEGQGGRTAVELPAPAALPPSAPVAAQPAASVPVVESPKPEPTPASATVVDFPAPAAAAEQPIPAAPAGDHTGMTLQSGRWKPSEEELADAGSADDVRKTIDSSFLGGSASLSGHDKTIDSQFLGPSAGTVHGFDKTIDSSFISNSTSLPGGDRTIDSSYIGAASTAGHDRTIDSSFLGSAAAPPRPPRDATEMWDSSHALSESAMHDLAAKAGAASRAVPSSSLTSKSIHDESLEQSLVIQPRILRPESAPATANARIDYNLLKKLGEGGMGIVYAARQQSIRRVVALKMLKKAGEQESFQREKFLAEAVITGDLEHPNIVPIYDLGRDETGAIFYAMKHVKGTPWDASVKKNTLTENLEILMKCADAVGFAHSRNVVHRDLKPENVMLGGFGEVLVMDWGLALMLGSPPANVAMGGTPGYMAPEMAMGPIDAIGLHSDVYLLGAMLFEIITGLRPHTGKTVTRCLMAAAKNEIVDTDKSGELLEIALKAMATNPADRYATVQDFQQAVRDYQSHVESITLGSRAADDLEEARRTDSYETFARSVFAYQEAYKLWDGNTKAKTGEVEAALAYAESAERRGDFDLGLSTLNQKEPAHVAVIERLMQGRAERESRKRRLRTARRVGMALAASIMVIVTGAFFWIRAEAAKARAAEAVAVEQREEAVKQKGVAEEQTQVAQQQTKLAEEQTQVAQQEKKRAEEQRQLAEQQKQVAEEQTQVAEMQRKLADEQRLLADTARKQEEYEGYIAKIGLAAAKIEENAFDHALELINECPPALRNWEWGRLRYLCSRDLKTYDLEQPIETIAVSPDGRRLAAGGWGSEVRILDADSGALISTVQTGGTYVFALAFSPDGKQLAAGTNAKPNFLSIWDATTGQIVRNLSGHTDAVLSLAYSRDGSKLLSGSYDNAARLWDVASGNSRAFKGHDWWVWSVAFSPDEQRFVTGSQDGSAMIWDVATGQPSPPFLGHTGPVYSATFAPDGVLIATASYDKRILLWRANDLKPLDLDQVLNRTVNDQVATQDTPFSALEGHTAAVRSVRFSSDGKLLVSGGNDNAIGVWDVATRQRVKTLRGHASRVSTAVFMPGDDRILSGAYDNAAKLWNISKYEEVRVLGGRVLKGHRDAVLGAAFSPDGRLVVTASRDRSAAAWDVATGQQVRSYDEGHSYLASAALFFPNGKQVLTSAVDNTARIWDIASGTEMAKLDGTGTSVAVALSHDGQWIATGSDEKELRIWEPSGKLLRKFGGYTSEVSAVAISPDDQYVLIGDNVGRSRLVRASDGTSLWDARAHSDSITAIWFFPDGRKALTSSMDNTVAQWDIATGREDRQRILKHPKSVSALAISQDGQRVLTACVDKNVRLWDLQTAKVLQTLPASDAATTDVAFSPDGNRALTTTADNKLHLWDLTTNSEIFAPSGNQSAFIDLSKTTLMIWSGAFSADGSRILTVGGAEAHLWQTQDAKQLVKFSPQSAVSSVHFSKGGDQLVTGGWDNAARIWNTATGAALVKLGGVHTRFVNASVFSPDGTMVLTASDDKTVRMWNATSGQAVRTFIGHEGRVTDVAFSSDGKWVLTASEDKTARIWDAETGQELRSPRGHTQGLLCARFSHDNTRVITGSDDTTARIWNASTGEPTGVVLSGHTSAVTSAVFTPDGLRVLTGSKDITAKLCDPATGKEILTLTGHTEEITSVAVSPDGSSMLTGSRDGSAIVWLTVPWREAGPVAVRQRRTAK